MSENIYKDLTSEELDILDEVIGNRVLSRVHVNNTYISNHRPWLAIFAPHLNELEKTILIHSNRYYYKQEQLDNHFPTNPESAIICEPFNRSGASSEYDIYYIETSTGAKIYEYASALCKANIGYIDRQSLAVSLTKHKNHKVKIIHLNNTVWILSNEINEEFVENSLALFPFLFAIESLQKDEQIIDCCKAVTKKEPVKQHFAKLFNSLADIRQQKKINIIKNALNSKIQYMIQKTDREIRSIEDSIQDYEQRLAQYYEKIDVYKAQKLGFESKKKVENEEVTDVLAFIEKNRYIQNLTLIKNNSYHDTAESLQLDIYAPINIYETEPLERQIANRVDDYNKHEIKSKIYRAFKRIFVDEELQMICQTFVKLDIANSTIDAGKESNRKQYSDYTRLPQPHLTRFNCWGDNKNAIIQALRDSDLIGAINNILIATQNINFTDSTVLSNWVDAIAGNSCLYHLPTCLSKADGRLWSIKEIVDQLDREEEATENNENEENEENEEIGRPELTDEVPF